MRSGLPDKRPAFFQSPIWVTFAGMVQNGLTFPKNAAITQHIPDKSFQMARYYGFYSNRSRGERNKACSEPVEGADIRGTEDQPSPDSPQATVLDVSDYKPRRIPSKTWRELIKKIWEVDPLSCPRCHHEMKIIGLISDPEIIERILRHLGLWKQQTAPSGRKIKAPEHGPVVIEDFDDGRPGYEEPAIVYHQASALEIVPPQADTGAVCPGGHAPPSPPHKQAPLREHLPLSCRNVSQPCQKIGSKMGLTHLSIPANQKPSESNFLSPITYHLLLLRI